MLRNGQGIANLYLRLLRCIRSHPSHPSRNALMRHATKHSQGKPLLADSRCYDGLYTRYILVCKSGFAPMLNLRWAFQFYYAEGEAGEITFSMRLGWQSRMLRHEMAMPLHYF